MRSLRPLPASRRPRSTPKRASTAASGGARATTSKRCCTSWQFFAISCVEQVAQATGAPHALTASEQSEASPADPPGHRSERAGRRRPVPRRGAVGAPPVVGGAGSRSPAAQSSQRSEGSLSGHAVARAAKPAFPILTAVQLLEFTEAADPRLRRAREVIERQVRHQARLIDDLLRHQPHRQRQDQPAHRASQPQGRHQLLRRRLPASHPGAGSDAVRHTPGRALAGRCRPRAAGAGDHEFSDERQQIHSSRRPDLADRRGRRGSAWGRGIAGPVVRVRCPPLRPRQLPW